MSNKFVVISLPRSGTTYFCNTVLNASPDVYCWDEFFQQKSPNTIRYLEELGMQPFKFSKDNSIADYLGLNNPPLDKYLEEHYQKAFALYGKKMVGFKLFYNHLTHRQFEHILKCGKYKIIFLYRKNLLELAMSKEIAVKTNQWDHRQKGEFHPFEADVEALKKTIKAMSTVIRITRNVLRKNNVNYFEIEYSEIGNLDRINESFAFLGVPGLSDIPKWGEKLNTKERYKAILNIDTIESVIGSEETGYLLR